MKRGFLKAGFDKPSSTSPGVPTSTPKRTVPNPPVKAKSGLGAPSPSSKTSAGDDPIATQYVEGGVSMTAFGGPDNSVDTLIVTLGQEHGATLVKHSQYLMSLTDKLAAFNAGSVRIEAVPGKGLAMIAKRNIPAGDIFLRERPLFVTPKGIPLKFLEELRSLMDQRMSPTRRKAYWKLHNCHPAASSIVENTVNIFRTNSIGVLLPFLDESLSGVYDTISRANHSCTPNTEYLFDYDTFCGEFKAMLPIKAGDEIYISYIDILLGPEERRSLLQKRYAFTCMCDACNPESSGFAKSKARRKRIGQLLPTPPEGGTDMEYAKAVINTNYDDAHISRVLRLLEEEGLSALRPDLLLSFARFEKYKAEGLHDYTRPAAVSKRGMDEAKRLGTAKKTTEWFELKKIHELCEAEQRPGRLEEKLVEMGGLESFNVDELLQQLDALELPEHMEFMKNIKTPEQMALFKSMINENARAFREKHQGR